MPAVGGYCREQNFGVSPEQTEQRGAGADTCPAENAEVEEQLSTGGTKPSEQVTGSSRVTCSLLQEGKSLFMFEKVTSESSVTFSFHRFRAL